MQSHQVAIFHRKTARRKRPREAERNCCNESDTNSSPEAGQTRSSPRRELEHEKFRRRRRKCVPLVTLANLSLISLLTYLTRETSCDFVCRKDKDNNPYQRSLIFPCTCQGGSGGLQISCQNTNLALLSQTLKHFEQPIERLEVADSTVPKLFGPILNAPGHFESLHSGALRELVIRNSQLRSIDESNGFLTGSLSQSLESLQLNGNKLQQVPSELALQNLTNLRVLNLANNFIGQLESSQNPNSNANNYATTTTTTTSNPAQQQQATNSSSSSSTSGLAKLVNLTELDLSWNRLTRLARADFSQLGSLESLNLCGNELAKLERNCLLFGRKLRQLDLSSNRLIGLDRQEFSELVGLEWLSLAGNQLTSLPRSLFSRNAKLYTLDLSANRLDDLDTYLFKSVRFLRRLNVSSNLIQELGRNVFAPTGRIKSIDLSQNAIQQLGPDSFKALDYLESLDLSRNQIVNISAEAFAKLASLELDLSFNRLARVSAGAFREITNLTRLDLSHNGLLSDAISAHAFERVDCAHLDLSFNAIDDLSKLPVSNFTRLQRLDVSHNQLTELNKKSFSQRAPLADLLWLDASSNDISQITGLILADKLRSLRQLNLARNSLRRLTANAFGQSASLLELDLSHNNLVELVQGTLSGLANLRRLDLRFNRLKKMIQIPSGLTHLALQFNEIQQVQLQTLQQTAGSSQNPQLIELMLDNNRISQIDNRISPSLLTNLRNLSLANNNLSSIPILALQDLINLQRLDLSGNIIARIPPRLFQRANLNSLAELDLSRNNLTQLGEFAFDALDQLQRLALAHNSIRHLPPMVFGGLARSLRHLDLQFNLLAGGNFQASANQVPYQPPSSPANFLSPNSKQIGSNQNAAGNPINSVNLKQLNNSNSNGNSNNILINNNRPPFQDLESLEVINLAHNRISALARGSFATNRRLLLLNLTANQISKIESGSFAGLQSLEHLSLRNNVISEIEPNSLLLAALDEPARASRLKTLDLSYNKLSQLKPGTFNPTLGRFGKLSHDHLESILLNNNKLTRLDQPIVRELDSLSFSSLANLNLSSNHLGSFQTDFVRWVRRGVLVDLRNQQEQQQKNPNPNPNPNLKETELDDESFECNCDLLPFVSWLEGVRSRNLSYWVLGSESNIMQQQQQQHHQQQANSESSTDGNRKRPYERTPPNENNNGDWSDRSHLIRLVGQYGHSARILSNITCLRPKLMHAKQLIDLTNVATRAEMNCDGHQLQEADSYKRLQSPIQLNNAQFSPPSLKISWSLLDPQIEVSNFVLIRAVFNQEPNLSAIRWNLATSAQFGLVRLTLDRLNYERRSHLFLEPHPELLVHQASIGGDSLTLPQSQSPSDSPAINANNNFNLICILYETSASTSSANLIQPSEDSADYEEIATLESQLNILAQASKRLSGLTGRSVNNVLDSLIADVARVNCLDLRSLLRHQQDNSARSLMIENGLNGSSSGCRASIYSGISVAPLWGHLAASAITNLLFIKGLFRARV